MFGATPAAGSAWASSLLIDAPFNISSFGEDVHGGMYVADYAGRVLRIEDTPGFPTNVTAVASGTSGDSWTAGRRGVRGADTFVKAVHTTQVRTSVNAVRSLAGLAAFPFTDPTLTLIRAVHVTQLRMALNEARAAPPGPACVYRPDDHRRVNLNQSGPLH
jgi:hypothetical protein